MREKKRSPFCNNLRLVAQALTTDSDLKVVWQKLSPEAQAGYDFRTKTIIMPAINTVTITYEEARKLNALSYHERCHHVLSTVNEWIEALSLDNPSLEKEIKEYFINKGEWPKDVKEGMHKVLLNYLEDCRIEQNTNYRLPGDIEDLYWYRSKVAGPEFANNFDLFMNNNPWGCIMQTLQYNLCGYYSFEIDEKEYPEQAKMYKIAWDILNDGRFHKSCTLMKEGAHIPLELTKEIIAAWKKEANRDIEKEIKKQKPSSGSGKGSPGEIGDPSEVTDGENELFNNKEIRDIEKEFKTDQEKLDGRYQINPQGLNEEVSDLAREEDPQQQHGTVCNPFMKEPQQSPYIPYNVLDRTIYPKKFPQNYNQVKESIEHKLRMTKKELARLLVGESQDRIEKYHKKGKLDRRRLHAILKNDERIFQRKIPGHKQEAAMQLVIDLSGSMSGHKARLAIQITCLFAEVLNALNIPFEVIGFNTSNFPYETQKLTSDGYSRVHDIVNRWIFKEFNESWSSVHARLGACLNGMPYSMPKDETILHDVDGCVGGANVDHEVILWGAGRLYSQPQKRKIQVVFSDGLPSGCDGTYGGQLEDLLIAGNNKIVASGIEQVAFGIVYGGVEKYYSKYVWIKSLDEMGPKALNYLSSTLKNSKV